MRFYKNKEMQKILYVKTDNYLQIPLVTDTFHKREGPLTAAPSFMKSKSLGVFVNLIAS